MDMRKSLHWLPALLLTCPTVLLADTPSPKHGSACHETPPPSDSPVATALLEGYGTGGFPIKTNNQAAQKYFDNGMQLAHAFAHKASAAAFRRAEQLDPSCAMCFWGEAWTRGPSINFTINASDQRKLRKLADKAARLAADGPPLESKLIAALQKRYHKGGGTGDGDLAYAKAMDDIATAHPTNNEIAVMAADAWMIPAANQYNSREHLDRAMQLLEAGLARDPNDTGLIHFYIHATEMDGVGAEALPYAEKLAALAPAASHLVHMPSHVYFRVGRYADAEKANLNAVAIDEANAARLKPQGGVFGLAYHEHNVMYAAAASLLNNDHDAGLKLAHSELEQLPTVKPDETFKQFGLGTAYVIVGRYGSAAEVASLPDPGTALPYVMALWHYARGELAARNNTRDELRKETASVSLSPKDTARFGGMSSQASAMVSIAQLILTGRLAMLENRWSAAEAAYRKAAELQEANLGTIMDPPAWWYPLRRSVAAALLAQGNARAAKIEAQQALRTWPDDPLSLRVLADCDQAMGETGEWQAILSSADRNWTGSVASVPLAQI